MLLTWPSGGEQFKGSLGFGDLAGRGPGAPSVVPVWFCCVRLGFKAYTVPHPKQSYTAGLGDPDNVEESRCSGFIEEFPR